MAKVTGSVYLNTQNFDKTYSSIQEKMKSLEQKKTVNLSADDKQLLKTMQSLEKYIGLIQEKSKLETKKNSGNWTKEEEKGLQSINRSLGQYNTILNKGFQTLKSINPVLAQQLQGCRQLVDANAKINQSISEENKLRKENEQVQKQIAQQEKSDLAELKQLNNERVSLEKKLLQSENNNTTAKKATNKELEYTIQRLAEIKRRTDEIAASNVDNKSIAKELNYGDNRVAYQKTVVPQKAEYQELIELTKQYYAYEKRLIDLKSDPKAIKNHSQEISAIEQEISKTKELIEQKKRANSDGTSLTDDQRKYQQDLAQKLETSNRLYKAQREDIVNAKNATSEFGDTIKKVFNYVITYKGFQLIQSSIQKALDTMKELDKAMTDIQLVTGGTKEETTALAQEYNQLAKEMGSTTTEVANGAGEWFNESRDH